MKTIIAPEHLREPMPHVFPPCNLIHFEEWFSDNYIGCDSERYFIDLFWTSVYVSRDYAKETQNDVQEFIDSLDKDKKYFTICQYDEGVLVDFKDLDVIQFNMSVDNGVIIPLLCTPHEKQFKEIRNIKASFIGTISHPIRQKMIDACKGQSDYYISTGYHDYTQYNRILAKSVFALCPRGYGLSSFRCYNEAMYQGAIPIYISDKFIQPYGIDFNTYGLLVKENEVENLTEILNSVSDEEILLKQQNISKMYNRYFTFDGCCNSIISYLEKTK